MAKEEKDKQAKEIKRLRKKVDEMADLIEVQGEVLHGMSTMLTELHPKWAATQRPQKSFSQGDIKRLQNEHAGTPRPSRPIESPGEPAGMPPWMVGLDPGTGEPVRVDRVTPNRDPEAGSEYTFWFTEEMCEKLGIPDIQRHLAEHPDGGGRLVLVDGPPTELLAEHGEIVKAMMEKGD